MAPVGAVRVDELDGQPVLAEGGAGLHVVERDGCVQEIADRLDTRPATSASASERRLLGEPDLGLTVGYVRVADLAVMEPIQRVGGSIPVSGHLMVRTRPGSDVLQVASHL